MRRKNLKQKMMLFGLLAAGLIILALGAILYLGNKQLKQAKQEKQALEDELNSNRQLVYVAARELKKGETVDDTNVMQQMIYTGLPATSYMTTDELGSTVIVDVKPNEPLMLSMVKKLDIQTDTRKYEVMTAHLMTTQSEADVIDVRVLFPNGEDYLLLAKKPVMDLSMEASIFTTYLNEEEILRMASAIVDVYTTTGARMYTTKYVEENIQNEAEPNYPVKAATLDLINSDPNVLTRAERTLNLQARNDLDRRLSALSDEMLTAVSNGMELEDTASQSVIREGIQIAEQQAEGEGDIESGTSETATAPAVDEAAGDTGTRDLEEANPADVQPAYDYGTTQQPAQQTTETDDGLVIEFNQ